jgi:hypothetical protein
LEKLSNRVKASGQLFSLGGKSQWAVRAAGSFAALVYAAAGGTAPPMIGKGAAVPASLTARVDRKNACAGHKHRFRTHCRHSLLPFVS